MNSTINVQLVWKEKRATSSLYNSKFRKTYDLCIFVENICDLKTGVYFPSYWFCHWSGDLTVWQKDSFRVLDLLLVTNARTNSTLILINRRGPVVYMIYAFWEYPVVFSHCGEEFPLTCLNGSTRNWHGTQQDFKIIGINVETILYDWYPLLTRVGLRCSLSQHRIGIWQAYMLWSHDNISLGWILL